MGLSKKKRKFVLQNAHLSSEELASKLSMGVSDIKQFLSDKVSSLQLEKLEGFWQIIKANWKFLSIVLVLTIVVYSNGLNANFVSDDYAALNQNNEVGSFTFLQNNFDLYTLQYFVFFHLFGNKNPLPYHVFNLVLFLISIVFAYVYIYLITKSKEVAGFSTFFFALLPVHVEGVTWISGKPYLYLTLTSLWVVISVYYLIITNKTKYLISLIIAAVCCLGSVRYWLANTVFLYLLTVLVLGEIKDLHRKINYKYLAIILGIVIILFIHYLPAIRNRVLVVNSGVASAFYNPFEQYPTAVSKYLQLIIFPIDLTLYHTLFINPVWLNWLIFLLYLVCLGYFYFKNKIVFFGLCFTFLATSIAMSPLRVSWMVAERYIFLGSLGICTLLGLMIYKLSAKLPITSYFLLMSIGLVYAYRIYKRNIDWQTNHNLWVNTCQVSPNSHNAWNNIGDDYDKLAEYENAIKGFTQSTVVKPDYADAFHNRANIFYKIGRLDLAKDSYVTAIKLNPNLFQSYLSLAQVTYTEKDIVLTGLILDRLLSLDKNNLQAMYMKAVTEITVGKKDSAISFLQAALTLNPNFTQFF